jgi:hypothetical protein
MHTCRHTRRRFLTTLIKKVIRVHAKRCATGEWRATLNHNVLSPSLNQFQRTLVFRARDDCSLLQFSSKKANAAQEILEPRVGPQRIENRMQQDRSFEARLICPVQPHYRSVPIAQSNMD